MVLGVDWMKRVSPITFDFNRMEVSFEKGGRNMTLAGGKGDRDMQNDHWEAVVEALQEQMVPTNTIVLNCGSKGGT